MSNNQIRAYAAMKAGEQLVPYQFDAGELKPHQVEVKVEYCGLCHSDLSVINNEWRSSFTLLSLDMKLLAQLSHSVQKPKD